MKIVHVTSRFPPHTGGIETHVLEISKRLAARGHEVIVVTADANSGASTSERRDGLTVVRHRGFAPDGAFHVAPGVLTTVRRTEADVVHAHNYHSVPMLLGAIGSGDARLVMTPHYHGGSADTLRDHLLTAYRPIGGWALRRAAQVVAVSDWERRQLRADFSVEATVIPNGLDTEPFETARPETRDRPYLLCAGRLEDYKGVQHAITALGEIEGMDLVVAGSGPYRETLERVAASAGVADRVDFLGYVEDERLAALYAGADVFLSLSSFEAYGMTVAEALAAGTPCVVREAGALADWATRADCVGVECVDPKAVAEGVADALNRRAPAERVPSWEDVVDRLVELY